MVIMQDLAYFVFPCLLVSTSKTFFCRVSKSGPVSNALNGVSLACAEMGGSMPHVGRSEDLTLGRLDVYAKPAAP